MKRYQIPCGKKSISIQIPDHVPVQWVESQKMAPVPNVTRAVEEALSRPIGTPRLRDLVKPNQTIALVVTDITRQLSEEIILPLLLKELEAGGIKKQDVTAVVATGTHRPNTPKELREKFGHMVEEISFINHDAYCSEHLIKLGASSSGIPLVFNRTVARADIRISTGVIETHLLAGYSGGVKSMAVGVAGEETIAATHNYQMLQQTRLGIVEGNEFRRYLTEATQAIGLHFIVNVVQTGKKEVVKIVAGDPVEAFHEGVKTARRLYEVEIDGPGEIVVSGVNYPKSRDLYQSTRAANVVVFGPQPVVTKGGTILIPAPCEDGCGHPGYCTIMRRSKDADDVIAISREEGFAAGEQKALILAWILKQAKIVMTDCSLSEDTLREIHLVSAPTLQDALNRELERKPGARVVLIPDGLLTLPIIKHRA
ncbi:MAG TPA: nickel-dependent lactate racemase [Thermodesulfobacteriota bacterium]|nr:nickel-dependent lactate racemase [Thermodesulfobacteriota bacterium]